MRECRNESGGEMPSMFGSAPGWRNLLLLAGMCLAFFIGQEQVAHATLGFSSTGGMNVERQNHTATVLTDGRVLIAGGTAAAAGNTAEIYNPVTGAFASVASPMTAARQSHTAIRLADGRVLLIGGNAGNASAEIFNPAGNGGAGAFTAAGSMSSARSNFTATLLNNGTVLVAGGTSGGNGGTFDNALVYDPGTGIFSAPIAMSVKRRLHTATLLGDGRVLLAGGRSDTGVYLNSAQIYNPGTGSFGAVLAATMSSPRESHAAVLLTDGRVLITGGNNAGTYLNTAEIFNPAGAGTFTATPNMSVGHYGHTATRLLNGKVLIAGGYASFAAGVTNAGELFTPVAAPGTGSFSSAGTMTQKRASHSAVLLTDGPVLLAGGTGDANSLITAELYNPAAIAVAPAFKIFLDTIVPDASEPQFFEIKNTRSAGSASLNLTAITISGTDQAMFTLSLETCGPLPHALAAGESCSVSVTFNPSSGGTKSASLNIASTDPEKPTLPVPLSGKGITFTSTVAVGLAGTGSGSVHSAPAGIACISGSSANCESTFDNGTPLTLTPAGDANSTFNSWSCTTGDCGWLVACSGPGDCIIEVESDVSATATFDYVKPAKVVGALSYDTLQGAYNAAAAGSGTEVRAREYLFTESPTLNGSSLITITGGCDLTYTPNGGDYSTVNGILTVGTGRVVLSNIIVQ